MVRRRMMVWGVAAALAGCMRVGFSDADGSGVTPDATPQQADAVKPSDRAPQPADSGRWGSGAWTLGPVEHLAELSSPADDVEVSLLADGLTLFFASDREGGLGEKDAYRARRPHRGAPFAELTNLTSINTPETDELTVTPAGLMAVLASARPGTVGAVDLWTATRTTLGDGWQGAQLVHQAAVSSADDDWDPLLAADGLRLYFAPSSNGNQVLRLAERTDPSAPFGPPEPVPGLPDGGKDSDPALTPDERVLVFARDADGHDDLWYAVRAHRDAPFGAPQPLPAPVNTPDQDREPFISADGSELYFSSSRPGGMGGLDIYRVEILRGP